MWLTTIYHLLNQLMTYRSHPPLINGKAKLEGSDKRALEVNDYDMSAVDSVDDIS